MLINMKYLAEQLGLDPDASDQEIVDKLTEERRKTHLKRMEQERRIKALEEKLAGAGSSPTHHARETVTHSTPPVGIVSQAYIDRCDRMMTERKVSFFKAQQLVAAEDPTLHAQWERETYSSEGTERLARIQASEAASTRSSRTTPQPSNTASSRVERACEQIARERNISFDQALTAVEKERPDLCVEYQREREAALSAARGYRFMPGEEVV